MLHNHRHCKAEEGAGTLMYLLQDQIRGQNLLYRTSKVYLNMQTVDMEGMDYDASKGLLFWTQSNDVNVILFILNEKCFKSWMVQKKGCIWIATR